MEPTRAEDAFEGLVEQYAACQEANVSLAALNLDYLALEKELKEQLESLREIEKLARELIELDAWAFIGWEPSGERKDAIENTFASLTEKLTGLDVHASSPASRPVGTVKDGTLHWVDGDGVPHSGPFVDSNQDSRQIDA